MISFTGDLGRYLCTIHIGAPEDRAALIEVGTPPSITRK